jgi:hypothetical protein
MLYKGGQNFWAEFSLAEFGTFLLVALQPQELWTNGDYSEIQRIK